MGNHKPQVSRVFLVMIYITFAWGQLCTNCQDECNEEIGKCSGSCRRGWDGPTCSRQNVALNRNTRQSSTYSPYTSELAVDGGTEQVFKTPPTCTHTSVGVQSAYWTVTLNRQYNIHSFRIYNRNESCDGGPCGNRLNGFTLSVGNSSRNYTVCYQDTTTAEYGPGDIIVGSCNTSSRILGDTVKIMINNSKPLTLCEVQIFVCTPGTYGPDCGNRCGNCAEGPSVCDTTSGLCPEGRRRCMLGYRPEKCDEECSNNTWGSDCLKSCGQCYNNSQCNTTTGDCPVEVQNPRCDPGYSGSGCMAQCTNNKWGVNCLKSCGQCYNNAQCNTRDGDCPVEAGNPQCDPGYSGSDCVAQCSDNTWGADCLQKCGHCYNITKCDTISGDCPVQAGNPLCDPGYSGNDCVAQVKASAEGVVNPAYIGGGVAAAVVLIIIVVVIIIFRRRRKAHCKYDDREEIEVDRQPQNNIAFQEDSDDQEDDSQGDVNPYVNADVVPTQVSVSEFPDYGARKKAAKGFKKEFEKFPVGLHAKHDAADKPENKAKSRYRSLVACE